ncbi:UDP-glycosyltransferase 74B1-like [Olea europaea var. sylvestris]|uniref:Glycosyltransferase n=1 Tax=Olea europaea subsp. europaea TaxID=158383 RepID=A0A8S0PA25_OLEEU|nr:UDP-glycosyltransferase 74B1-like [Olea europaea var. sylvestris]CAA2934817.1 UDP-glycosyltransferase 74B1-like [Olea europaea subsp. europaea]
MEAAGNEKSMKIPHVIAVPYPSQGHINPLLQFAKRLAAKGVKATFATTFYTVKSIHATNVVVEPISDGFDDGGFAEAKKEDIYLNSFRENGSRTLSQIIEKYEKTDFPVNCIIYDSFLPWALDVAKEHGIYGASFFTNSAAVCAVFSHIHDGSLTLPVVIKDKPLILPGLQPLSDCDVPRFIRAPESYPAYLAMKMSQFSNLEKADYVFANTFEELEGQEAKSVSNIWPAKLIGPMVPSAYLDSRIEEDKSYGASLWKPLSENCVTWLKNKPNESVIYISFGSMVSLTSKQMEEMASALMCMNSYFLWVVRETERNKLPAGFFDLTKGKGLVVSWCNQLEMLAHRAIGCFVTHCGWNSTIEGLCLGVPMVGMPQWSDQMPDAKYIEDVWRVGVRVKEDEFGIVKREELLHCLKQVMEGERGEEIKRNARKWRELAKEAIDEGGTSDKCINDFVGKLKSGD